MGPVLWDIFCRVIDNFGDAGVCWRLCADLAARGESVRLWIDDPAPLAWMAAGQASGVVVQVWRTGSTFPAPGQVVIEAFGCDLPASFVVAMATSAQPPVWINLEYLSAETYVERSHALRSPQFSGPGTGLAKWFFYPGFTSATGGLLREPGLLTEIEAFDRQAWLATQGWSARPGQRVVSLFCYEPAPLADWGALFAAEPTLLLVAQGAAQRVARDWLASQPAAPDLQVIELPWLSQPDYDRLLWSCDLNFVRGEDSFVRAQWAGAPFVWQIYPQHGAAHAVKLDAFLERVLAAAAAPLAQDIRRMILAWNDLAPTPLAWPEPDAWRELTLAWRRRLFEQDDLGTQLISFCRSRLGTH